MVSSQRIFLFIPTILFCAMRFPAKSFLRRLLNRFSGAVDAFLELERITHELAVAALLGDDIPVS